MQPRSRRGGGPVGQAAPTGSLLRTSGTRGSAREAESSPQQAPHVPAGRGRKARAERVPAVHGPVEARDRLVLHDHPDNVRAARALERHRRSEHRVSESTARSCPQFVERLRMRGARAPSRRSSAPRAVRRRSPAGRHLPPSRRRPGPCTRRSARESGRRRSRAHAGSSPPHGRRAIRRFTTRSTGPRFLPRRPPEAACRPPRMMARRMPMTMTPLRLGCNTRHYAAAPRCPGCRRLPYGGLRDGRALQPANDTASEHTERRQSDHDGQSEGPPECFTPGRQVPR